MAGRISKRGRELTYELSYHKEADQFARRAPGAPIPPIRIHNKRFLADIANRKKEINKLLTKGNTLYEHVDKLYLAARESGWKKRVNSVALRKKVVPVLVEYELASLKEMEMLSGPKKNMARVYSSGRMHSIKQSYVNIKLMLEAMEGRGVLKKGFVFSCLDQMHKIAEAEMKKIKMHEEMDKYYGKSAAPLRHL